jgi:hypothetical protein
MAANENDCDQLEAAKQLLDVSRKYATQLEQNNSLLRSQTEITRQLMSYTRDVEDSTTTTTDSLSDALDNLEKMNNTSLDDLSDSLDKVAKKGKESNSVLQTCANILKKVLSAAAATAAWGLEKLWDMLKLAGGIVSTAIGAIFDVIGAVWDLGKAILGLPFAAYSWLIGKANELMSGGGSAYAEAIRALKTEYGALDQVAPSTIMKISRETQTVSKHGLSAFRIWGSLGERMKALTELAQKMGPTFENFAQEFADTGLQIPALLKGLGLADEQVKTLGDRAKTMGTRFQDELVEMHKQSWNLGGAFSQSTKLLNRDMAKAMADVKRFGNATTAQLGQSASYARSLGVELEKIAGILDAFETFEGAADVASKFAQSFNVHIEAFDMLNAQDPASVIDHIRKKFSEAGQDASTFNRAQLDILAQGSKLPPEVAKQVFSLKNQGRSLEEIQKESEKAQNSFANLDSALHDLRKSIEYLVMSGSMPKGGFLDMFLAGIERGINLNPHTRGLFRDVARSLKITYYDARSVFDGFVKYFPGVEDAIKGLREVFNPGKMGTLIRGINDEIIKFFKLFAKGQMTFGDLVDNLSGRVKDYFGAASAGGSKFLDGLKLFGRSVAKVAGEIIEWLGSALADGIREIAGFIRNPDSVLKTAGGIADGAVKVGESLWEPLWKGLNNAVNELLPALEDLFNSLLERIPILRDFMSLFEEAEYRSKKVVFVDKKEKLPNGKEIITKERQLIEDANAVPEKTNKLFVMVRNYWDTIKDQFDQFINSPDGIFSKFVSTLLDLKTAILALVIGVGVLGTVSMLGRAASLGTSVAGKLLATTVAAGAAGVAAYNAPDVFSFVMGLGKDEKQDEKLNQGNVKLDVGGKVSAEMASPVSDQQKVTLEIDKSAEGFKFIESGDFSKQAKELGQYLTNLQTSLGNNSLQLDEAKKQKLLQMLKEHEASAKKIKESSEGSDFDLGSFKMLEEQIAKTRNLLGDNSGSSAPGGITAPKEPKERILPSVAVDTLKAMSFSDTSESLKMLTDDIGGKGAFKGLVQALSKANGDIKSADAISSAKNVSEFFMHVEQVAASLGGLQRLVDIVGIDGVSNFQVVSENIQTVEKLFSKLISDGSIGLIVGHISRLSSALPSTDLTQKVRDFFDHLDDITNRLKVLSGSEPTQINAEKISGSVENTGRALEAIKEKIPVLRGRVKSLSDELSNASNAERKSASSLMSDLAKSLDVFKTDFETVAGALRIISDVERQFTGDAPNISATKIQTAIALMSSSVQALSTSLSTPVNAGAPASVTPPSADKTIPPDLKTALGSFMGPRGGLKEEFSGLVGGRGKLTVFNKFISGVATQIGSDSTEGTILGSMRVFSNFSSSLAGYKTNIESLDLTVLSTFVDKVGTDLPDPSKVDFSKLSSLAGKLSLNGLDENLVKINSVLGSANAIADNIKQSSLNIDTIKTAVSDSATAFSGGGTGPSALTITPPNININLTVKVALRADNVENAILQGATVLAEKINSAASGATSSPGGAPPLN